MEKSSTSKAQKIAIWAIIVAMTIGSIGAYFVIILENNNAKIDQDQAAAAQKQAAAAQAKQQAEQAQQEAAQAKMTKDPLDGYTADPFDKTSVTSLSVQTLKPGTGKAATTSSTVVADYFGWTSDGTIFDSSKKDGTDTPVTFPLNQVITGWTNGLNGVKQGAVVKLLIPASQAYGAAGQPQAGIGANEPLAFIIELEKVE